MKEYAKIECTIIYFTEDVIVMSGTAGIAEINDNVNEDVFSRWWRP